MKNLLPSVLACVILLPGAAGAVDHRIEKADEAPPADALSAEIAGKLDPAGVKVVRGTNRTVCEIWLCKELAANSSGSPVSGAQYPFQEGTLVGVIRFPRDGSDFRDQDIAEGVYTLRYGLQPVDGAHVGTFPTRDFLMLSKAESDQTVAPPETKALVERSAEAAETTHPAILALLKVEGKPETHPAIVHNEEKDWWIARLEAPIKTGEKVQKSTLDVVVAGTAGE
jgi:hypothetical protein